MSSSCHPPKLLIRISAIDRFFKRDRTLKGQQLGRVRGKLTSVLRLCNHQNQGPAKGCIVSEVREKFHIPDAAKRCFFEGKRRVASGVEWSQNNEEGTPTHCLQQSRRPTMREKFHIPDAEKRCFFVGKRRVASGVKWSQVMKKELQLIASKKTRRPTFQK